MSGQPKGVSAPLTMPAMDGHAADAETLLVLYGLVRYHRPALIVEAGTYMGHAACTMALALRDGQIDGEVWTADVKDYGVARSAEVNGLSNWVRPYLGDFAAMLSGPLAGRTWRMAFVDSGMVVGETAEVVTDIRVTHSRLAREGLTPGGIMIVDDCGSQWDGIDEIRSAAGLFFPYGRGMVIVQRDGITR